jgi:hypothetical protein
VKKAEETEVVVVAVVVTEALVVTPVVLVEHQSVVYQAHKSVLLQDNFCRK